MSAFRLYAYVKYKYNNDLHASDFEEISSTLQISYQTIRRNLHQLEKMGVCIHYAEDYWRFNSWKKFAPSNKNRIISVPLEHFRSLDNLNTYLYTHLYRSAYRTAKKNRRSERKHNKPIMLSLLPVSASFVKSVTSTNKSEQYLLRRLKKAKQLSIVKVKTSFQILKYAKTKIELLEYILYKDLQKCFISRNGNGFKLTSFNPNEVGYFCL